MQSSSNANWNSYTCLPTKTNFSWTPRYKQETQRAEENGLHKFCDANV